MWSTRPKTLRCIEGIGDFDGQRENQLGFHRTPSNSVLQRKPIEKLHSDEGLVTVFADLVNGADVGMAKSRGGLCFALETG